MQEKYWKYMVQIKAWIFYLDVYTEDSYRWDRIINIVVQLRLQQVLQHGLYGKNIRLSGLL